MQIYLSECDYLFLHRYYRLESEDDPRSISRDNVCNAVTINLNTVRYFSYYLYNVLFVITLLCFSAVGAWTITPPMDDGGGARLSLDLNLILATTAFKFVIAGQLPAVSYLTVLDRYIVSKCPAGAHRY